MALSLDQRRLLRKPTVSDWLRSKMHLRRSSQYGKSVTRSSERIVLPIFYALKRTYQRDP